MIDCKLSKCRGPVCLSTNQVLVQGSCPEASKDRWSRTASGQDLYLPLISPVTLVNEMIHLVLREGLVLTKHALNVNYYDYLLIFIE